LSGSSPLIESHPIRSVRLQQLRVTRSNILHPSPASLSCEGSLMLDSSFWRWFCWRFVSFWTLRRVDW